MYKLIGILFFLIGISLLLSPTYESKKQEQGINEVEQAMKQLESGDADTVPVSLKKELNHALRLQIPSIKLNQVVLDETTPSKLNKALTQIKKSQTPGEGNFAVAGHRSQTPGRHFNRLDEVKIGDVVSLEDDKYVYEYIVVKKKTVLPREVNILDDVGKKRLLSLVTCTPMETATHRLVVVGELKQTIEKNTVKDSEVKKK